jgi:hypothetical protein
MMSDEWSWLRAVMDITEKKCLHVNNSMVTVCHVLIKENISRINFNITLTFCQHTFS